MARVLGIDLGSHAVKVAVMEGSLGRYVVKAVHARPVERPAEGTASLGLRLAALSRLVNEEGLRDARAGAVGWPTERASVHVVELPFDDRAKVARALPYEVEDKVPFDLDEMVMDHRSLAREAGRTRVLAALAPREEVRALLEGVRALGLEARHVPLDADLLACFSEEGVQAVVDVGHERTLVALTRGGHTVAVRAVEVGGQDLVARIATAVSEAPDAAARLLQEVRLPQARGIVPVEADWEEEHTRPGAGPVAAAPDVRRDRALEAVDEGVQDLLTDLRATLLAFEDLHGVEVDEVLLTGGGSVLPGLAERLAHGLGVPVRMVPPEEAALGRPDVHGFGLAVALGRRAVDDVRGHPLDLRQGDLAHHGSLEVLKGLTSYGVAAAVFFVLAAVVVFVVKHHRLAEELAAVEVQISEVVTATFPEVSASVVEDPTMAVAVMQENTGSVTARMEALSAAVRGEPPTLTLLKQLSEAMPPPGQATVDVRELTLSETAVSFRGETDGYEQAARIEASLQNTARFKAANKGEEKKTGDKVTFSMTIPLEAAEGQAVAEEG